MYDDEWLKGLTKLSNNVVSWGESVEFAQDELIRRYEKLKAELKYKIENYMVIKEHTMLPSMNDIDIAIDFLKVAHKKRKDYTTQLHVMIHNLEKEINNV